MERSEVSLWKVWKTCPQILWISLSEIPLCGKCGKVIPTFCGQLAHFGNIVEKVENLSTISVDNLSKSNGYVESVDNLSTLFVDK
jgi:hypothetical protein